MTDQLLELVCAKGKGAGELPVDEDRHDVVLQRVDTRAVGDAHQNASEQTSRDAVAAALHETPGIDEKLVGVVLNRAAEDFDRYYRERDPVSVSEAA